MFGDVKIIMHFKTRIQSTNAIKLPKYLKDINKKNNFTKVKWIVNKKDNTTKIQFTHDQPLLPKEEIEKDDEIIFYRNVYHYSMIRIPVIVLKSLNCKIFDKIIMTIGKEYIQISAKEKIRINDLAGIIGNKEEE